MKRWMSILLAALLAFGFSPGILGGEYAEVKADASISLKDPSDSGWDCVWFGSYPQSEVTAENVAAEYQALENASENAWNDENEIAIGGSQVQADEKRTCDRCEGD